MLTRGKQVCFSARFIVHCCCNVKFLYWSIFLSALSRICAWKGGVQWSETILLRSADRGAVCISTQDVQQQEAQAVPLHGRSTYKAGKLNLDLGGRGSLFPAWSQTAYFLSPRLVFSPKIGTDSFLSSLSGLVALLAGGCSWLWVGLMTVSLTSRRPLDTSILYLIMKPPVLSNQDKKIKSDQRKLSQHKMAASVQQSQSH